MAGLLENKDISASNVEVEVEVEAEHGNKPGYRRKKFGAFLYEEMTKKMVYGS